MIISRQNRNLILSAFWCLAALVSHGSSTIPGLPCPVASSAVHLSVFIPPLSLSSTVIWVKSGLTVLFTPAKVLFLKTVSVSGLDGHELGYEETHGDMG